MSLPRPLRSPKPRKRRLFYEEQLKQAKEVAASSAEVSFQQVQQSKGLVQLDAQAKAMIESLALLRAQVAAKEVEVRGAALVFDGTQSGAGIGRTRTILAPGRGCRGWSSATTLPVLPIWGWAMFRGPAWSICAPSMK